MTRVGWVVAGAVLFIGATVVVIMSESVVDIPVTPANSRPPRIDAPKTQPDAEISTLSTPGVREAVIAESSPRVAAETKTHVPGRSQLRGRVEASDGTPIANASVTIFQWPLESLADDSRTYSAVTDVDGTYVVDEIEFVRGSKYERIVRADGYLVRGPEVVEPVARALLELPTIVLERVCISIAGTVVGDTFDVTGKMLALKRGDFPVSGLRLERNGTFEFFVQIGGDYRIELGDSCLEGNAALSVSIPKSPMRLDCGIVRASKPSTHFTGRVQRIDGSPATSGEVRFEGFSARIGRDGAFDLVACSPGPSRLDISWGRADPESGEQTLDYVFRAMSDNVLVVQPHGILVRIERKGVPTGINEHVVVEVRARDLHQVHDLFTMPAKWRIQQDPRYFGILTEGSAGAGTITLTVADHPSISKEIALGADGLLGPEVVVTFDYAELGLE